MTDVNKQLMLMAMQLGEKARHKTGDNPWVGCVIVNDGQVLGEGYTRAVGAVSYTQLTLPTIYTV